MRVSPWRRTTSRRRRRTRLRSTALPTLRDTVKPTRTGPASPRGRIWSTKAAAGTLVPVAALRKSARCFSRSIESSVAAMRAAGLGAEPLASAGTPGLDDLAAARGLHARAETVTALAHKLARLVGPLHDQISADGAVGPGKTPRKPPFPGSCPG